MTQALNEIFRSGVRVIAESLTDKCEMAADYWHAERPEHILPAARQAGAGGPEEGQVLPAGGRSHDAAGCLRGLEEQQLLQALGQ